MESFAYPFILSLFQQKVPSATPSWVPPWVPGTLARLASPPRTVLSRAACTPHTCRSSCQLQRWRLWPVQVEGQTLNQVWLWAGVTFQGSGLVGRSLSQASQAPAAGLGKKCSHLYLAGGQRWGPGEKEARSRRLRPAPPAPQLPRPSLASAVRGLAP